MPSILRRVLAFRPECLLPGSDRLRM